MKKRLKINGIIICLAVILLVSFPDIFFRSANEPFWGAAAGIFGAGLILLGQILRASARGYKSEYSQSGHSLIRGGPYSMVRNPMYLGILFIGSGIVLALFNWWVIIIFLGVFIWRYIFLIFKEEEKLSAMFTGEYSDYKQKVPCLFPSLKAILQSNICGYLPLRVSWIKKEIGSIAALLFLLLFMEGWVDIKGAGLRVFLKDAALLLFTVVSFVFLIFYLIRCTDRPRKDASGKGKNNL